MTPADHKAIIKLTSEMIVNFEKILDLKLEIIGNKLDATIEQTTKTNGSVQSHSERIRQIEVRIPHTIANCPQQPIIQEMRDEMITSKGIKKMFIVAVSIIGAIVGIIATVVALIQKGAE